MRHSAQIDRGFGLRGADPPVCASIRKRRFRVPELVL